MKDDFREKRKFELFICSLGNGLTVCNKAVEINNDYKVIAHISNAGNINFYCSKSYIPKDAMDKINDIADKRKKEFKEKLEKLPIIKSYETILNDVSNSKFIEFVKDSRSVDEKIQDMTDYYLSIS